MWSFIVLWYFLSISNQLRVSIMKKCWILSKIFLIYWDDHNFYPSFCESDDHIYRFEYVDPSLHPRDKCHLITVYDHFNLLLKCVVEFDLLGFFEDFCICVNQGYLSVIFHSFSILIWLWCKVMLASYNEFESVSPSSIFWKSLRIISISSYLNICRF